MSSHQLRVNLLDHVRQFKPSLLAGHLRVEDHLKKQISEFLPEVIEVSRFDRIHHLIGLFQKQLLPRVVVLLPVPGAAFRTAQDSGQLHQLFQFLTRD